MIETYQGGCHCGRVRFRVRADLAEHVRDRRLVAKWPDDRNGSNPALEDRHEVARLRRRREGLRLEPVADDRVVRGPDAALGGATLDNEENYVIKKLFTAAGAIQIENQARI